MTPQQLLDAAAVLLTTPSPTMRRCWQRACASLTRVALEQALDGYWKRVEPTAARCPMRHQLLALSAVAGDEVTALARSAWYGLCRAVHHHTYELPPTVAELHGWHREVTALLALLDQPPR
ncbi:hypothetical protein HC028_00165 [Planosporangium flavigriseum]|uniref:Uncharacterized protein n=1 Tax=Planosporangium flavigriseum TaxID=373681 RepID=A0A8J3PMR3_9ACTN|nr:hypothetical protein [Planosporangium flavigriseum]NJC62939.1 hypothetical protein [Planosporangium flavigriseum]GIG73196.1 hypothetical protein Pfl04_16000 [Planosporangium flavigriseum]